MNPLNLLIDLHKDGRRQGPGSDAATERAIDLGGLDRAASLKVADIGCGTGASALVLARLLNARITAVDFLQEFLDILDDRATRAGVAGNISTLACSMDNLPFADGELDVIWSEGAIYNIGFEKGVAEWRRFLKAGGLLAVSEITWLTATRPAELQAHWEAEYPGIGLASAKLAALERNGYSPVGYFVLPERCWLDEYYRPMQARFAGFLDRNGNREEARNIVAAEQREIALYETFKEHISYGFYIARKVDPKE